VNPHHFDADPYSTYHPGADPDSDFLFDAIPYAYPDQTFHPEPFEARIRIQILASKKRLKLLKSAKIGLNSAHFGLTSTK
jgi:hypothetical protein